MVPALELAAAAAGNGAGTASLIGPLLIAIVGSGGLLGAIIAFIKLRGDRDSAAVAQAQGAAESLEGALAASERQVAYWQARYEACHLRANEIARELMETRRDRRS